ncbi:MAG: DUF4381 domain-containing protein [Aureliella sp.]
MNDPGSLDNLRDIAVAPPVSWWPLAPGWWFVIAGVLVAAVLFAYRRWVLWRRDEYRRAALAELAEAIDDAMVVQILKRAAITAYGRKVGSLSGDRWCKWLIASSESTITEVARERLACGVYRSGEELTPELLLFARDWIAVHQVARGEIAEDRVWENRDHNNSREGQKRT